MFTQVGVKTIVAGGAPRTGPMQATSHRGAADYSADALDLDINQLSSLNVSDAVLATLPPLNSNGYRDSGVFTTILGVNLRDQVRPNDTTPLQFKYEAADCRIFYTLDNVYNMSRLWRDAVTASFDDTSRCVDGSTGYANTSKPAPQALVAQSASLNLNLTEPDSFLVSVGLDLTGGPQDISKGSKSGRITECQNGACPSGQAECQDVVVHSCTAQGQQQTVKRCVPIVQGQDFCPSGTTWKKRTKSALKTVSNRKSSGAFSSSPDVWTGPCSPNALYNEC